MPNDKTGEINVNVLVVGCGRLGRRLAEMLDQNGDDVAVIDSDPLNFLQLSDAFSGITVTGVPMDMKVLQSAASSPAMQLPS